eukprot:188220-Chlamydomonas_euryale.AAC.3
MDVHCTFNLPIVLYGCKTVDMDVGSDGQTRAGRPLWLKATHGQCRMSSLELMVHRRSLQLMEHVLRKDKNRVLRQAPGCSLARSVAADGRVEQLTGLKQGHRNNKDLLGCTALQSKDEEVSGGGKTFRHLHKLTGHTKLIPWQETRAAAAERALDSLGLAGRC